MEAEPRIADLNVGADLLGPITRHSAPDRKDPTPLGRNDMARVAVEIEIGIERRIGTKNRTQHIKIAPPVIAHEPDRDLDSSPRFQDPAPSQNR